METTIYTSLSYVHLPVALVLKLAGLSATDTRIKNGFIGERYPIRSATSREETHIGNSSTKGEYSYHDQYHQLLRYSDIMIYSINCTYSYRIHNRHYDQGYSCHNSQHRLENVLILQRIKTCIIRETRSCHHLSWEHIPIIIHIIDEIWSCHNPHHRRLTDNQR